MALVLADRVREITSTTGTGSVTLIGSPDGFETFSAKIGNGNTTYYTIADQEGDNWEVGVGTYNSTGNVLERTTVLSSSNGGSKVAFGSGDKDVFVTLPAEKVVTSDSTGTMATQNANSVAITGGAIDGTTIGSTTPAAGTFTTLTATGQTSLGGVAGANNFRVLDTAATVNYWNVRGGDGSTTSPRFSTDGTGTNIAGQFASKGTGAFQFLTGGTAEQLRVTNTASAVNYVQVTGGATGNPGAVTVSAQGSDSNVTLKLQSKGSGFISLDPTGTQRFSVQNTNAQTDISIASNGIPALRTTGTTNQVNYFTLTGSVSGSNSLSLSTAGSDTNIDLALTPKGTGLVKFGTYTAGAPTATGYISIKAANGTTYKVLVGT